MIARFFAICLSFTMFCTNSFAAEDQLSFNGEEYVAVHSESAGSVQLTEYLRPNESLEDWSQMLSVQEHPEASRISDVMNPYAAARKSLYMRDVGVYFKSKEPGNEDAIFEFLLKSQDGSFVEFALVRAVAKDDQPVVLYILSRKIPTAEKTAMEAQLKDSFEKRQQWFPALGRLSLGVSSAE